MKCLIKELVQYIIEIIVLYKNHKCKKITIVDSSIKIKNFKQYIDIN